MLTIITDTGIPDDQIGGLIRGERIGWPRLRSAVAQAAPRLPRDHGHLAALDGSVPFGLFDATASLLVGKLSASGRQNAPAAALKEAVACLPHSG